MIRTRFAPSPTGYLHIGSVRVALYCWLYARRHQGQFVLRIEDTDRERSTEASVATIIDGLKWLGLSPDEGPVFQTSRMARYQQVADQLLAEGKAYRCSCSRERLDELREQARANGEKPRYDGFCRDKNIDPEIDHVIRFKNPQEGLVSFDDAVHGATAIDNKELDDLILVRTDGLPTYNFAVVVDDRDMKISHVIRGDDHINNTPRQINLFKALDAPVPTFAHLPMILGPDGKKLSKRHGAVSVLEFAKEGILPDALLNYLVRLGWSHGDDEIFSRDEMIKLFDIKDVNKSASAVNPEKLLWLNQHYLKTTSEDNIANLLQQQFHDMGIEFANGPALKDVVVAQRERVKTIVEMAEKSQFFYQDQIMLDEKAASKHLKPDLKPVLTALIEQFSALESWEKEPIHQVIVQVAEQFELKMGKVAQPIRVAVTGNTISPSIDLTLQLIGKVRVLSRLQAVIGD